MGCSNNCTIWENGDAVVYHADPDIAGPGILVVFIASSTIALVLSLVHIILTPAASPEENIIDFWVPRLLPRTWNIIRDPSSEAHVPQLPRTVERRKEFAARVIEKIILNLSDQLLLTGCAVLIAGFWTHCSISVYHFAITSDLAWFASNVHLTTLVVLWKYLRDRPVLRNWRAILMTFMAIFLSASTILQGHRDWYISWPYDAQCVFNDLTFASVGGVPARWMYANLALILTGFPPSIMRLYEAPCDLVTKWLYRKPTAAIDKFIGHWETRRPKIAAQSTSTTQARRLLDLFLIACAKKCLKCYIFLYKISAALNDSRWFSLMFCLAWFGLGLASLFGDRKIPRWDMDGTENAMTFGQIVPILVLGSTIFVVREGYDDVKIDMKKEDLSQGHSSRASLVHIRNPSTQTSPAGQDFEMSGALQASEDHLGRVLSSSGHVGTESGLDSQTSGVNDAFQIPDILRRPTWPQTSHT